MLTHILHLPFNSLWLSRIVSRGIEKGLPAYELSDSGCKEDEECITPIWITIEEASKLRQELIKCECKKTCETGSVAA